eukprot:727249-Hanusia_phi.AAC.11
MLQTICKNTHTRAREEESSYVDLGAPSLLRTSCSLALIAVEEPEGQPLGEAPGSKELGEGKERQDGAKVPCPPAPLKLGSRVVLHILRVQRAGEAVPGAIGRVHPLNASAVERERCAERE